MTLEKEIQKIESKIHYVRGQKVMLDSDLADLYEVPTKRLNEQVKRNSRRFPEDFCFVLTNQELINLKSQIATSSEEWGGRRKPSCAFTEQGIAMLSSVLKSDRAIDVNIAIMRTFTRLRQILNSNHELEMKILKLESKYDGQFKVVFDALKKIITTPNIPHKRIKGLEQK